MVKVDEILKEQKSYFLSGATLDVDFRIEKLKILKSAIINYKEKIVSALKKDLRKSEFEAYTTEILPVLEDINLNIRNLKKWASKIPAKTPFYITAILGGAESYIQYHPKGAVLIISPFNYPFLLSVLPIIGAIGAGNTVILKPSGDTLNTTKILMEMINSIFAREYVYVLNPKNVLYFELLNPSSDVQFDHIFFTGSTQVGKKILEAASKNLIPATLELGGKSPCVVDKSANIINASRSIVRGKLQNAGQTCIAPDYLLVHKDIKEYLIEEIKKGVKELLGPIPQESENFGRIVNEEKFHRLKNIIDQERENIIFGGEYDECGLFVSPTLIDIKIPENSSLKEILTGKIQTEGHSLPLSMKEEIFGPILPILEFENVYDVVKILKTMEKPLAAYIFSSDNMVLEHFLNELDFGGSTVNETMFHGANNFLPFGGTGLSGLGKYHGRYSFETFSNPKSILKKKGVKTPESFLTPGSDKLNSVKKLIKLMEF